MHTGGPQFFVAEAQEEVAGQQYFLFSWRLLLCDALLSVYLLFVSLLAFLLALNVTPNIVANAILKYASLLPRVGKGRRRTTTVPFLVLAKGIHSA